jgi:hypothetical protein
MRNPALHRLLEAFTVDVSGRLTAEAAAGAEIPFELVEERGGGRSPLYCYRPLTAEYVRSHIEQLSTLPSYAAAAAALADCPRLHAYIADRGQPPAAGDRGGLSRAAMTAFLESVFADRTGFGFEPANFEAAYGDLERALDAGHTTTTVISPILGVALDRGTDQLALGEGLSLIRGDAFADAPVEAAWADSGEPTVLAMLAVDQAGADRSPISVARTRFRRIVSALRLFERGGYALGPLAWTRSETGAWRSVPIGVSGRPRFLTLVAADQEQELRAFCRLLERHAPGPELAWALARFEMGCERLAPFEALTDYLLALRALLEPEGPASGRLAHRLAAICARPGERAALAQRTARAVALERAVITGLAPADDGIDVVVDELAEHLRAILRDALCGHLDADLCAVADDLLADSEPAPRREITGWAGRGALGQGERDPEQRASGPPARPLS